MDPNGPSLASYNCRIYPPEWAHRSDEGAEYWQQCLWEANLNPYQLGHQPWNNPFWEHSYNPWTYSGIGKGWVCDKWGNPTNIWYDDFAPYVNGQFETYMDPGKWSKFWLEREEGPLHGMMQQNRDGLYESRRRGYRLEDLYASGRPKESYKTNANERDRNYRMFGVNLTDDELEEDLGGRGEYWGGYSDYNMGGYGNFGWAPGEF